MSTPQCLGPGDMLKRNFINMIKDVEIQGLSWVIQVDPK